MKKTMLFLSLITALNTLSAQTDTKDILQVSEGNYLNQKPPGETAELFAPGLISNGLANRDVAISPDGKEMYFSTSSPGFRYSSIICTKQINGKWTSPEVAPFASDPRYKYLEPALSYDGTKLFFISTMPKDGSTEAGDEDIWVVDRKKDKWGEPYNLGEPVNSTGGDFFPSLTQDGTLYFTRDETNERVSNIYRSRLVDGKYTTPEKLPKQVNCGSNRFNAYVAPDESFVVVPAVGVEEGYNGVHYYIVYRNEDDSWLEPMPLGAEINAPRGTGWSFYISPDEKYIFYMASKQLPENKQPKTLSLEFLKNLNSSPENGNPDIYWVDAKIIDGLRPDKAKK